MIPHKANFYVTQQQCHIPALHLRFSNSIKCVKEQIYWRKPKRQAFDMTMRSAFLSRSPLRLGTTRVLKKMALWVTTANADITIHPTDTVKAKVILNNINYNQLQLRDLSVFLEVCRR